VLLNKKVAFQIAGTPGPQGSRVPGRRKDDTLFTRPSSKAGYAWMNLVATEAMVQRTKVGTLPAPYRISLFFWFTKARTSKLEHPSDDLDKLARATLDGFTHGGLIEDDRYVISLELGKDFHAPELGPGVEVVIEAGNDDGAGANADPEVRGRREAASASSSNLAAGGAQT
jgi:Holliday junction resolvase RusA-like endonuclease